MFLILLFITFAIPPGVSAASWDDFTNNFATDIAPLLTLFGEQVTKQFLSESLTIWDNIIFAMAPLGILTAVVSAIRVRGGPSLRAFIGRGQESQGVAEAELLSCTSETTSEVWTEGGIARVFGKAEVLEIVVRYGESEDRYYRDSRSIYGSSSSGFMSHDGDDGDDEETGGEGGEYKEENKENKEENREKIKEHTEEYTERGGEGCHKQTQGDTPKATKITLTKDAAEGTEPPRGGASDRIAASTNDNGVGNQSQLDAAEEVELHPMIITPETPKVTAIASQQPPGVTTAVPEQSLEGNDRALEPSRRCIVEAVELFPMHSTTRYMVPNNDIRLIDEEDSAGRILHEASWQKTSGFSGTGEPGAEDRNQGRHVPNLSLNFGIKRVPLRFTIFIAIIGVILQIGHSPTFLLDM
ncbi:hypothetical protein ABW19_dt0209048 [Dactylella cylindrospora]|nr:hypothetical protein ABW19_dt0209048 [Dactylella cylindrospora]